MKAFSVSAATSASQLRNSSSTCAMMPSTCSGRSPRAPRSCRRALKPPRASIASSRYLRLNQSMIGLRVAAGITPTISKVRSTGKIVPLQRDVLADLPAELPHRLLADERAVADRAGSGRARRARCGSRATPRRPSRGRRRSSGRGSSARRRRRRTTSSGSRRRRPGRCRTLLHERVRQPVGEARPCGAPRCGRWTPRARGCASRRRRQGEHGADEEDRERDRQRREHACAAGGAAGCAGRGAGRSRDRLSASAVVHQDALVEADDGVDAALGARIVRHHDDRLLELAVQLAQQGEDRRRRSSRRGRRWARRRRAGRGR